jgi:CubicO group peptidase (beta-lactamase class C family)
MRKNIWLLLLLFPIASEAQKPTDKRLAGLDTFALRILKEWNAPGVSIAVVEKNKVIYTGGFGFRDVEMKLPVTENTLFAIGSCTKAFTASLLGMLEKDGNLSLDKPVRDYLPELKFQNEYTNAHATLRDLISHRTGLPRHDFSWYGSTASRSELLSRIQYQEPSAELREKWQYNNFMYLAQGMVIEKLTGKSWEVNIKEKILQPLGMNNTNMSVIDMEKAVDRSLAYRTEKDKPKAIPYRNIDAIGPAGSINSCAKDMAKWLITWINNGKFNEKEIIPTAYRSQAMTVQVATGGGLPSLENPDVNMSGYGLGWSISSYRGHYRVEHGGGIDGFITSTSFFPTDSIGIFVVSNQGTPTGSIRNFIADRMLKLSYRPWGKSALADRARTDSIANASPNNDSLNRKPGTKPSHELVDYTGIFENKGYGKMKFFLERDTLWADYNEAGLRTKSYLQHYHYDIFRVLSTEQKEEIKDAPKVRFQMNNKGEITSFEIRMEPAVDDIVFKKEPETIEVEKSDLKKYEGEYELAPGVIARFYIKGENTLYAFIEGQPEYELVASDKNKFFIKILPDYKAEFEENDKGEIIAVSFVQPNGTFKATKKK